MISSTISSQTNRGDKSNTRTEIARSSEYNDRCYNYTYCNTPEHKKNAVQAHVWLFYKPYKNTQLYMIITIIIIHIAIVSVC